MFLLIWFLAWWLAGDFTALSVDPVNGWTWTGILALALDQ